MHLPKIKPAKSSVLSRRQNHELKYQSGTNRDRRRDVLVYVPLLPFCCSSLFSLFEYNEQLTAISWKSKFIRLVKLKIASENETGFWNRYQLSVLVVVVVFCHKCYQQNAKLIFFYSIMALTVLLSLEDFIPCYYCQSIHNNFTTIFQE